MTYEQLLEAINECNKGLLNFNLGHTRAFLFHKRWYPLRAIVNRAKEQNGENSLTTDRAQVELSFVLDYFRIENINFENNFPVELNALDTMAEIRKIVTLLKNITD